MNDMKARKKGVGFSLDIQAAAFYFDNCEFWPPASEDHIVHDSLVRAKHFKVERIPLHQTF